MPLHILSLLVLYFSRKYFFHSRRFVHVSSCMVPERKSGFITHPRIIVRTHLKPSLHHSCNFRCMLKITTRRSNMHVLWLFECELGMCGSQKPKVGKALHDFWHIKRPAVVLLIRSFSCLQSQCSLMQGSYDRYSIILHTTTSGKLN